MGVLCEVYIADQKRALMYEFCGECKCKNWKSCKCWAEYDAKTYDHVESHRVYDRDFAQLLSILRGKKHKDSVLKEFEFLKQFSESGPWIQKVPEDLPKLLAKHSTEELTGIAKSWSELMDPDDPPPTELIRDYLKLLHKLCKKSLKVEKNMYLWTCL